MRSLNCRRVPHEGHSVIKVKISGPYDITIDTFLYLLNGPLPVWPATSSYTSSPTNTAGHTLHNPLTQLFFSVTVLAGNWHYRLSKRCRCLCRRKCISSSTAVVFGSLELCSVLRLCLSGSRRRLSSNTMWRIYIGFQPPPRGTEVPRETVATVRRFHFPTFFFSFWAY